MRTTTNFRGPLVHLFVFGLITALAAGCTGCGSQSSETDGSSPTMDQPVGDGTGHDGAASGTGAGTSTDAAQGSTDGSADTRNQASLTPAEERTETGNDLRGMRAILVAELEAVRGRLKDGTRPADAAAADKQRAAELAQGLERLDRTLKALDESNDATWETIRASSLKEAGEFHVWMQKYGLEPAS